jgi:uncharacterized membrane protein
MNAAPAPLYVSTFGFLFWVIFGSSLVYILLNLFPDVKELPGRGSTSTPSGKPITVATVQVALLGSTPRLQEELKQVAEKADTNSQYGLKLLLQDAALLLLRNPDFSVYGSVSSSKHESATDAERAFDDISLQSQSKYQEETLSNTPRRNWQETSRGRREGDAPNEYIVVTLLASSSVRPELPRSVESQDDVLKALRALASIPEESVQAAEVVWTPQKEEDCLSQEELLQYYPMLSML